MELGHRVEREAEAGDPRGTGVRPGGGDHGPQYHDDEVRPACTGSPTVARPYQHRAGGAAPCRRGRRGSSGWPALWYSTTALTRSTTASRKWAMTNGGRQLVEHRLAAEDDLGEDAGHEPQDRATRSRRRGRRLRAATTTSTTPMVINTFTRRFPNSTQAWYCSGATMLVAVQLGQSLQPRPEPVRRTAPPLTIPTARAPQPGGAATVEAGVADSAHSRRSARPSAGIETMLRTAGAMPSTGTAGRDRAAWPAPAR